MDSLEHIAGDFRPVIRRRLDDLTGELNRIGYPAE